MATVFVQAEPAAGQQAAGDSQPAPRADRKGGAAERRPATASVCHFCSGDLTRAFRYKVLPEKLKWNNS
jgi:hypothetical protein